MGQKDEYVQNADSNNAIGESDNRISKGVARQKEFLLGVL
jgi:hypothetical protein